MNTDNFERLKKLLEKRILVLDGAMGSLIQCECKKHDFVKESHSDHDESKLPDLLVREHPELIRSIHRQYLEAGADIIETDSFNSNRFSLADYGMEEEAYGLAKEAARIAREEADKYTLKETDKPRFVAGSVGPTKYMLSLAEEESVNFDSFVDAYKEQIRGLLDGGADIILLETIFDTMNVKAALYAISLIEEDIREKIPVMVSATIANSSGRLLSGQSIEAFYTSVMHGNILSIGLNCGFGSADVLHYVKRLSEVAETAVSVYPNAGLPDDCGEYNEDPVTFAANLEDCLQERLVNIIGGCCGTTPDHIRALVELVLKYSPRHIPEKKHSLALAGMDRSALGYSKELIQVGERTNVAGSAKFAGLIREKKFGEALDIAVKQVEAGARVIDICMDDGLEDAVGNMTCFLGLIQENQETGSVPVMVDSSDWNVIVAALKKVQGKCIVNSISLKDGEEEFLRRAREIRRLGAAAVIMLFDENGQAETFECKCKIAERAYNLLVNDGFEPSDIIFDPNVLTVGSGLKEKDLLALDFIKATKWIKENLPYVSISGGISNLSFAFRGNNPLRQAMHTVFLYHAGKAGLNMAIVNAGMLSLYEDIDLELLVLLEDLILWRRDDAVVRLIAYAEQAKKDYTKESSVLTGSSKEKELPIDEKIKQAVAKGRDTGIEELMKEALTDRKPMNIINGILMPAMKKIGEKFGEGKMFLPQVIKSAQVMKKAVSILQPYIETSRDYTLNYEGKEVLPPKQAKVIIATVKGDVHDIGKNIVSLVVSCNGFKVVDLGVRVDSNEIADMAESLSPDAVLLSGLISPSLNEMVKVCEELERRNLKIPVIIGGAATSELYTAVKIAPVYSGDVYYSSDAAVNLNILMSLSPDSSENNRKRQEELREIYAKRKLHNSSEDAKFSTTGQSKRNLHSSVKKSSEIKIPKYLKKEIILKLPLTEVEKFIDWNWLLSSLDLDKFKSNEPKNIAETKEDVLKAARELFETIKKDNLLQLEGIVEIFEASSEGNDIIIRRAGKEIGRLPMLRAEHGIEAGKSVADFIASEKDYLALFAVTGGVGLELLYEEYQQKGDYYSAFIGKLIADRLAEAFCQWIYKHLAEVVWGFPAETGCRIAFGYPSAPDHTLKRDVFEILKVEDATNMRLTDNAMIMPSESVCGMIFSSGEYINIGKIGEKQQNEYAHKRGITVKELSVLLPNNIL